MSEKCPYCGSDKIQTERRLDGFHHCVDCHYSWKLGSSLPKQTVFDQIAKTPETLAPNFVVEIITEHLTAKFVVGYRSTIIPGKIWKTETEAITATVAKLKESQE